MHKRNISSFLYLLPILILWSCSPGRYVQPLQKGEIAISGTLGGPLIGFGKLVIPLPLTTLGAGYGLREDLTLFGDIHTTAASFGVIQWDLGAVYSPLKPNGAVPGVSLSPVFNFGVDIREGNFKFWPQLDANLYWNYTKKRRSILYTGVSNWFELAGKRAHGEVNSVHWLPNLQVGHNFVWEKWDFSQEFKWLSPQLKSDELTVDYKSFNGKGGLGIYFGISRKF